MLLHIDDTAIRRHVGTLKDLHKSALPVVVRQTLNAAAFDVKTNTMPREARRFEKRKPTFFQANSRVEQARGFDIDNMRATVGFKPKPGDKSHSVEDLEQQEHGGDIDNRAFIALPGARVGRRWGGMVRNGNRMSDMNDIVDPLDKSSFNRREGFLLSAIHAKQKGSNLVFGTDRKKGARVLYRITKMGRNRKGDTWVNATKLYNVKAGRDVEPGMPYRHFMAAASGDSAKKMFNSFKNYANKKIAQLVKP